MNLLKFLGIKVQYIWRNKDYDIPVEFIRVAGESNGRKYALVSLDGRNSYVPADELVRKVKF